MGSLRGHHTLSYFAEDAGEPVPFSAPRWAVQLPDGDDLHRQPNRLHTGEWWIENPTDIDDLWEQEKVRDELLRLSLGYFDWLKNQYVHRDLARNLRLVECPRYNAKRETRRLIGDYVLTQNDCMEGKVFDDAVAYCGWPLDVHHPRGLFSGKEGPFYSNDPVPITTIPYRSLYSKNVANLLMAGRCVSVSHLALGTVRVQNTLATLGQAAGTAAALCARLGVDPRELGKDHFALLRSTLLRDDQYIPGAPTADPADLALQAKILASSNSTRERYQPSRGVQGEWQPLDVSRAMAASCTDIPQFARVWLKNTSHSEQTIEAEVIGIRDRNDFAEPLIYHMMTLHLSPYEESWKEIVFDAGVITSENVMPMIGVRLSANPQVRWREELFTRFQRIRAWRLDPWNWQADTSHSLYAEFSQEADPIASSDPEHVAGGPGRILAADRAGWISDPDERMPQFLEMCWPDEQEIATVAIVFDTDLVHPPYSYLTQPHVPLTVKSYRLSYDQNGAWRILAEADDNILRYRRHVFPSVRTRKTRVEVLSTHGDASARILGIRVYKDALERWGS